MEKTLNVYTATAHKLSSVIKTVRESRMTGQKMKSLDRQFRRNGLNILIAQGDDRARDTQLKDLEFTHTLLEKHAKGIRASSPQTAPCDLVETEFDKSVSMRRHKENIVSIVSLLTPKKIRKTLALPTQTIVTKPLGKSGKIMPLRTQPKITKERAYGVR